MPMFEQAMEMLAEGRIDVAPILTHVFDYRDFPEAFDKSSNYEDGVIKSLITWQPSQRAGGGVAAAAASAASGAARL